MFNDIAFLDDDPDNKLAIGPLSDYMRLVNRYPMSIPSFGDGFLREKWVNMLEEYGFIVPTLIHPSATVSTNAKVGSAVVVEAKSIISAGAVLQEGVLISSGSVIEVMAHVEQFSHVGAAVTVTKNAVVPAYARISSGTVVKSDAKN